MTDPGKKFHYHNPNYQILALVVESVSKEKFSDYLKNHIFLPMNMNHTVDVPLTNNFTLADQFSSGHIFILGKAFPVTEPEWFIEGAAGMISTAQDMAQWLAMNMHEGLLDSTRVLDSASIQLMQTNPPGFPYGMGWFKNNEGDIYHSGILWTYSSQQMITHDGYGILVLFNAGLNPFMDYHSFLTGINAILHNQQPGVSDWSLYYTIGLLTFFIIALVLALRRLFRTTQWLKNYQNRSRWKSYFFLLIRLTPLIVFLLIPKLLTVMSGRVLNWPRIFLMLPDVITVCLIVSLMHAIIVMARLVRLRRRQLF